MGRFKINNQPWFIRNPSLLEEIKVEVKKNFPSMILYVKDNKVFIRGTLQLPTKDNSHVIDQYAIEIELPDKHPEGIPTIKELNGRIPRIADRHVNPNGTICLFLPDEKWKYYPDGSSITDYIRGPVISHFLGQCYFEQTGKFPFGERSHGSKGIIEFYSEILQTDNIEVIKTFIYYLSKRRAKGHWPCYCMSGKKLRNCHFNQLLKYRGKIKYTIAIDTLNHLR